MRYIDQINEFGSDKDAAVTLGKFDGLHRGHQKLIKEIRDLQKTGVQGMVFTIVPENIPHLMTPEEKRKMVESYGIDTMIRCPFVPQILGMEPEHFISEILVKKLRARYIVVGTDFRFGCNRSGDVQLLNAFQEKYGYRLKIIEKECHEGREISSSYVKESLQYGNISLANHLLGYEYCITGNVMHGKKLGRRIGIPTINLLPPAKKVLPPCGVYFSETVLEGSEFPGITNIGYKPTVNGTELGVETYLYGVDGDFYEQKANVKLLDFRRHEMKFNSLDDLKRQMEMDLDAGKEYFHVG